MPVKFIGLKSLTQEETNLLSVLTEEYVTKYERNIPDFNLIIRIKKLSKTGDKHKYSLHARMNCPTNILVSQAFDWDFPRVIHKAMQKLGNELQHKFKTEGHKNIPKIR